MNNPIEFHDLLKIVYEAWEKKAKEFSDTYHKKHVTYFLKLMRGEIIPNDYDLQKIIDFTYDKLKEDTRARVRRQITSSINCSSLSNVCKGSIVKQEGFKNFLREAFVAAIGKKRKPQRAPRAKLLMAGELLLNITNADLRLKLLTEDNSLYSFLNTGNYTTGEKEQSWEADTKEMIVPQQFEYLRHELDNFPLKAEFSGPLIDLECESEISHKYVRSFYDELAKLRYRYESFLGWLDEAVKSKSDPGNIAVYNKKIVKLKVDLIKNNSLILLVLGLMTLDSLRIPCSFFDNNLRELYYLEPQQMMSVKDMERLYEKHISEYEGLVLYCSDLTEKLKNLVDKNLDSCIDEINKLFEIKPGDKWNEVVGKAISLRKLGRPADAVAVFSKYCEMFGSSDSTAVIYSEIASRFTENINTLNVDGGVFIYRLNRQGKAARDGLCVGDIIIRYNDKIINCMPDFVNAERITHPDAPIQLEYLRLRENREFLRGKVEIECWPIGIEIMPI